MNTLPALRSRRRPKQFPRSDYRALETPLNRGAQVLHSDQVWPSIIPICVASASRVESVESSRNFETLAQGSCVCIPASTCSANPINLEVGHGA
jgi:hypothetical protein